MLDVIKNPMEEKLLNYVKESKNSIFLCAPFIKKNIIKKIIENNKNKSSIICVTNMNISSFLRKASDIEALEILCENEIPIYNYNSLHAKIYLFDNIKTIITSSNLTFSGLNKNYEYGLILENEDIICRIKEDTEKMISNEKYCTLITKAQIIKLKNNIIKQSKKIYKIENDNENDEILITDLDSFKLGKKDGWLNIVFTSINQIDSQYFNLHDLDKFIPYYSTIKPNNTKIEDKIRQVLQYLRNLGLISFVDYKGTYKKLYRII